MLLKNFDVQVFDFLPSPRRFSEKPQAGRESRIKKKTANRDTIRQLLPTHVFHQPAQDHLERHAVQRIF